MTLDEEWLRALNRGIANPLLDAVFVVVAVLGYALPYGLLVFAPILKRRRLDAWAFLLAFAIAEVVVFTLKLIIARPRPDDVRLLLDPSESYSMPSGHAARAFCGLVALWRLGPGWRIGLGAFAGLTCVGRVYLGAHFPSDVVAGAGFGVFAGLLAVALVDWGDSQLNRAPHEPPTWFARTWVNLRRVAITIATIDYVYRLRLLGQQLPERLLTLVRPATYWGAIRVLGPLLAILGAALVFVLAWPAMTGPLGACLGGYFVPFGIEFGIPLCVGSFGVPWWLAVAAISYIDLWLSLFLILNFDVVYRIRRLGRWLDRVQAKAMAVVQRRPWILRVQFLGIALFVFLPIAGTGIVPGVLIGRLLGMGRMILWAAVMIGTIVRLTLFALGTHGVAGLLS